MKELRDGLKEFVGRRTEQCKVLVVGDVMLDQYYYGEVTRISPEAPVRWAARRMSRIIWRF